MTRLTGLFSQPRWGCGGGLLRAGTAGFRGGVAMKRRGAVTRGEEREALQRVALRQPPEMFLVKPTFGWLVGLTERSEGQKVGGTDRKCKSCRVCVSEALQGLILKL